MFKQLKSSEAHHDVESITDIKHFPTQCQKHAPSWCLCVCHQFTPFIMCSWQERLRSFSYGADVLSIDPDVSSGADQIHRNVLLFTISWHGLHCCCLTVLHQNLNACLPFTPPLQPTNQSSINWHYQVARKLWSHTTQFKSHHNPHLEIRSKAQSTLALLKLQSTLEDTTCMNMQLQTTIVQILII